MISFSRTLYNEFQKAFKRGDYKGQRYGQAFFNHFNLHKLNHNDRFDFERIYRLTDEIARNEIALYIDETQ